MVADRQPLSADLRKALQPLIDLGMVEILKEDPEDQRLASWHVNPRGAKVDKLPLMTKCGVREAKRAIRERHSSFPWVAFVDPEDFLVAKRGSGCLTTALKNATANAAPDTVLSGIFFPLRSMKPLASNLRDTFTSQFDRVQRRLAAFSDSDEMYYPDGHRVMVRSDLLANGGARLVGTNDVAFEPLVNDNKRATCTAIDSSIAPCTSGEAPKSSTAALDSGYAANFAYRSLLSLLQQEINYDNGPYHFNADGLYRQFLRFAMPVNTSEDDASFATARLEYASIPMMDERMELLRRLLMDGRSAAELAEDSDFALERTRLGLGLRHFPRT